MMKVTASTVFDILSRLRDYFQGATALRDYGREEPFRSELYGSDQMNAHGRAIAAGHTLQTTKPTDHLLKRLDDNEQTLLEVRNLLVETVRAGKTISPGGEWLLDNFYLIEEQVVLARKHLPKGYSEALPCLATGVSAGLPRAYDIVLEIISHSDGRVDANNLGSFVAAYQTATKLTLGELWAIPIMLRLAVIENLRRVGGRIALDMIDHTLSDYWADKMMDTVKDKPGDLILTIADMVRSNPPLSSPFVAGFTRNLRGKGPALALPLSWLEERLAGMGTGSNDLVRIENQKQAADQVSIRNSIGTLRFIGTMDWKEFVDQLSSVEQVLSQDPAKTYSKMDFATRDCYRHIVEAIALDSPLSETEIAQKVVELASQGETPKKSHHVGYYLIDKGLRQTVQATNMKKRSGRRLLRRHQPVPLFLYLLAITVLSLVTASTLFYPAYTAAGQALWMPIVVGLLALSVSTQFAVPLVNWLSTLLVMPRLLPRMDFSKGIPKDYRALVAVPTLLTNKGYILELLEGLEIRYLANKDARLHYALLTDFMDADTEFLEDDQALVELASDGIAALNRKYQSAVVSQPAEDIFFLLHRPRKWNPAEKKWMGYERKRGKLTALNALLRGRGHDEFSTITGDYHLLEGVRYVITLDSDTHLPREAAWKLVAAMAHPLNEPVYSEKKRRVVEGYGILQPRVDPEMPSGVASLYARMQGHVKGIDPYTRVSSDVYQDLFGEGSFIGKGIYDVDTFELAFEGLFRDNRILSHDLLEGCYGRSGLISDVSLYEEDPAQYSQDIRRHHRWIRGDWQIAAWIMPFVRDAKGHWVKNRLSALSRWKIFDNLRRSLLPFTIFALLVLGWYVLPSALSWTLAICSIILLSPIIASGWHLLNKPEGIAVKAHVSEVGNNLRFTLIRFVFNLAILPYEAWMYGDAVIRSLWRMNISHKKLLEWTPSAVARTGRKGLGYVYLSMAVSPVAALGCVLLLHEHPQALGFTAPIIILWILAPALIWQLGQPGKEERPNLSGEELRFLHTVTRKTWAFFEEFVTAADNWLPPDNIQENAGEIVAHRTSPTNMGLSLLAQLTAYDFGYSSLQRVVAGCDRTLQSMDKLERYKGHFFNWYDTQAMSTLHPRYVSTVDSGNLAGHLLTLRQGLIALPNQPIFHPHTWAGLHTTAGIPAEHTPGPLSEFYTTTKTLRKQGPLSLAETIKALDGLVALAAGFARSEDRWIARLTFQLNDQREDLLQLASWCVSVPPPFEKLAILDKIPTLNEIAALPETIAQYGQDAHTPEEKAWLATVTAAAANAAARIKELYRLADVSEKLADIEYDFLLDPGTSLLRIGYNVDEGRADNSYYDLLASEVRLGIFTGIAQGKLPQESWFALSRLLTNAGNEPVLLSWSGSMFEYLMPNLVMPTYENTLLWQTSRGTVKRQIEYGGQKDTPWGISESGYNMVDANLNYQYRAFGVPGLGLTRGLEDNLVIAPYATVMALMVYPGKATDNLKRLQEKGMEGEYGFYEAMDYTPSRVPRGKEFSIIQQYMVHHQGMGFLSLAYLLLDKPMQQRFTAELRFQATLLLLQERIPRALLFYAHTADLAENRATATDAPVRIVHTPHTRMPEVQLLSNGRYQVMINNAGSGYSRWKDLAVTRWREDPTRDEKGIYCYIRDINNGNFWSAGYEPTQKPAKSYVVSYSQGHVEFRRRDPEVDTNMEIVISPEDDMEMRRVRVTNRSPFQKTIEITSYAEVVIAPQAADEAHPAFSNLFVQTEIVPDHRAILCTRRPRSEDENPPFLFHLMNVHGATTEGFSYDTARLNFVGRGRTLVHPHAMDTPNLSNSQGAVLDPIVAIRCRVTLKANQTATIDLIQGISETREACEAMMNKYRDEHLKNRAFELSWTHSQVLLRQINATEADAQLYGQLAASVIYANPVLRGEPAVIMNNLRGQSGLWSHSVSGDLPIVLLHLQDPENIDLVKQLIQAHAYWRLKGLSADLVIWNEDHGSYRQELQDRILGLTNTETGSQYSYKPGKIYVRSADQISPEDRILFESVARVVLYDSRGTLAEQVNRLSTEVILPPLIEGKVAGVEESNESLALPAGLLFFNGTGGFTPDGKEYKILTDAKTVTPAPWANVIANPEMGTVVSESGSAYTWAVNAHEYRITPWSNDAVSDAGEEAFYLRDEESGRFWSPSPFPATGHGAYITTHGFGYSSFEHVETGVASEMRVYVDASLPVKFVVIRIRNRSGRRRRLSATGYLGMVLGDLYGKTAMHVVSEQEPETGALLFRNRYNTAFAERVSFFRIDGTTVPGFTTDRGEFIGRNKDLRDPQAMSRKRLSGRSGAGMDPCAALQLSFELAAGADKEIIFQIGSAANLREATDLLQKLSGSEMAAISLAGVKTFWHTILGAMQVHTPDPALDLFANGWLLYQTTACRIFGRSGFYQSGGAFGFRDQLQDTLALLHTRPNLTRDQILLHASRQFVEGDVQHWWHPPEGRGVRTHCSDDYLWLPYVTARYIATTGDKALLSLPAGFLESRLLNQEEDSLYDLPVSGNLQGTIYEHCVRAIRHGLRFGRNGLPLMGIGDWNDGMDKVGHKGQGESVWLAWFLYDVLVRFAATARVFGDELFAGQCVDEAEQLQKRIEASSWDGEWYRRAYFDNGSPLGSAQNVECRIDSISQSWSVITGAGEESRAAQAMASVDKYLVRRDLRIIQLLDPPFDGKGPDPGYIRGYVPGVRENGGQYSHAAIWTLMAFAARGDRERVWELFKMIHPLSHSVDAAAVQVYKVEPYVMAADVYANESHRGRGGWTWYTGSAGWMYQFITGSLLGFEQRGAELQFRPCLPPGWDGFTVDYRWGKSVYHIKISRLVDPAAMVKDTVSLVDDGGEHNVELFVT
jgi:cellobiose phosphorylase